MTPHATDSFTVNGRAYRPPARPIVAICLDGSADEYVNAALVRNRMPNLQRLAVRGYRGLARAALPSFTNVNNAAIVTGVSPEIHGISGNFFFDAIAEEEVMMNSGHYLRCDTILAAARRAGRSVALVTAKEKLRDLFAAGLFEGSPSIAGASADAEALSDLSLQPAKAGRTPGAIAFSSEKADQARLETHGIERVEEMVGRRTPPIYSAEASLYVLWSGVALLERGLADFLYLSTTDFIQHKFQPDAPEAIDFYTAIDRELGRLLQSNALVGITADHGMNAKQKPDGTPNVLYLQSLLEKKFGGGFRVILPITDPYVLHHGALGSFATIHLPAAPGLTFNSQLAPKVAAWLMDLPGITEVYDRATAAGKLELPEDRIGDLVVLSGREVALGRTPEYHDLKAIEGGLRSHGGRYEEMVPFIVSEPLKPEFARRAAGDVRNFDLFDFTVNGTLAT